MKCEPNISKQNPFEEGLNFETSFLIIPKVCSTETKFVDSVGTNFDSFNTLGILGGVGPTYSFVQLVQGVKDLFWLPVEQYRRDGRIMRGLQRGASSFTTSSAMAFIELTNKLVQVVHVSFTYKFLSSKKFTNLNSLSNRILCEVYRWGTFLLKKLDG